MKNDIVVPDEHRHIKLVLGYSVRACADGIIIEFLHYDPIDDKTYIIGRYFLPTRIVEDFVKTLQKTYRELAGT